MKGFKFIVSEKFLKKLKCKIFTNMKNYMKNDKKICTLWRFRLSSIRESMSKDCKELAISGYFIRQKEDVKILNEIRIRIYQDPTELIQNEKS